MEFMDFVASRKSVGSYADCEAEEEKVSKILEAARLAPSWANKQCTRACMGQCTWLPSLAPVPKPLVEKESINVIDPSLALL